MRWRDLMAALNRMAVVCPEQLDRPAQVMPPWPDQSRPVPLHPVISLESLAGLGVEASRSSEDNAHRPEDYVLLTDWNPFAEDGAIAYDMLTGERIYPGGGRKPGKVTPPTRLQKPLKDGSM